MFRILNYKAKLHLKIPDIAQNTIYKNITSMNQTVYFYFLLEKNGSFFNMITNEISLYLVALFCVHIDIYEFYLHYPTFLKTLEDSYIHNEMPWG